MHQVVCLHFYIIIATIKHKQTT